MEGVAVRGEERLVRALCFLTDMLVFTFGLHAATLSVVSFIEPADLPGILRDRAVCMVLFGVACVAVGTCKSDRLTDRFDAVYYPLLALGAALLAQVLVATFLLHGVHGMSRRELVLSVVIAAPVLAGWRLFAAGFLARHFRSLHRSYFVLGSQREAKRIAEAINENKSLKAKARQITFDALRTMCAQRTARNANPPPRHEEAIIAHTGAGHGALTEIIELCDAHFRRTYLYPSQHDAIVFQQHALHPVAGIPLIQVAGLQRTLSYPYVKRLIDVGCAAAGIVLSLPILVVTAVAVMLTSRGPILFKQRRMGRNGRPFKVLKFRSMVANAEGHDAPVRAQRDDPRVTPVGRVIRKYKIDEIPQLFNVLRGEMSLVGPRPLWNGFFDGVPGATLWERRLAVRPGVTSLAHVLGSSHAAPADLLRYDLMYIKNLSFLTDLRILLATVRIVLSGKGEQ